MLVLVNFANELFTEKQKYQNETAIKLCNFDHIYSLSPNDIDQEFFQANKEILSSPRGNGYWLWKPYFILKILTTLNENDYLFYCDSGAYFIDSLDSILSLQKDTGQDIIIFSDQHLEKYYTKKDLFVLLECDSLQYTDTKQTWAGTSLWKKTPFTIAFLEEWLRCCQDPRMITDMPNTLGQNDYPEFKEHRHDQSIFSLLCKKHDLQSFPDPTQYGNEERLQLNDPRLKQILHHTKGDKVKRTLLEKIVHEISRPFKPK